MQFAGACSKVFRFSFGSVLRWQYSANDRSAAVIEGMGKQVKITSFAVGRRALILYLWTQLCYRLIWIASWLVIPCYWG
jgi:hypothetical protein